MKENNKRVYIPYYNDNNKKTNNTGLSESENVNKSEQLNNTSKKTNKKGLLIIGVIIILAIAVVFSGMTIAKANKMNEVKNELADYTYFAKSFMNEYSKKNVRITEQLVIDILNQWMPEDMCFEKSDENYISKTRQDPWKMPYNISYNNTNNEITIWSNGANKTNDSIKDNNSDDVVVIITATDKEVACSIKGLSNKNTQTKFIGNGYKVPIGHSYKTIDGKIYNEETYLPIDYEPQTGDVLLSNDYEYIYNNVAIYDKELRTSIWTEADVNGWAVKVKDTLKTEYQKMESLINGIVVRSLTATFADCANMTTAPELPTEIVNMDMAFRSCGSLKTMPEIPNEVQSMEQSFWCCSKLTKTSPIASSVKNMKETFAGCCCLTGDIYIEAYPSQYDKCFDGTAWSITLCGSCPIKTDIAKTTNNNNTNVK